MKPYLLEKTVLPVRVEPRQAELLQQFQATTGLNKSFVIRHCIDYALEQFTSNKVDILTFQQRNHDHHDA